MKGILQVEEIAAHFTKNPVKQKLLADVLFNFYIAIFFAITLAIVTALQSLLVKFNFLDLWGAYLFGALQVISASGFLLSLLELLFVDLFRIADRVHKGWSNLCVLV